MACIERAVKCTSFDVEIMASVKYLENGDSGIFKPCKYWNKKVSTGRKVNTTVTFWVKICNP